MLPHKKFCARCGPVMCSSRTDERTCNIILKPNYSLLVTDKFRKREQKLAMVRKIDLGIRYSGEYRVRPITNGGLDIVYNNINDRMLSDHTDFNFHDHGFEITRTIPLDWKAPSQLQPCPVRSDTKFFLGDARLLTGRSLEPSFNTISGPYYFSRVYMDAVLIGYAIRYHLSGYDAVSGVMHPEDGVHHEVILRYTDKETKTVDGIMFAGPQTDNFMNFQEGVDDAIQWCAACQLANS